MACPLSTQMAAMDSGEFSDCLKKLNVAHELMDVLNGKWKMEVILCLLEFKSKRFRELQKSIPGISSRVLSSVLKDLEQHHLIVRKNLDPATTLVEYELTTYGQSMRQVMGEFVKLGMLHRREVLGKTDQ